MRKFIFIILILLSGGCAADNTGQEAGTEVQTETVADSLDVPWMIENSEDGFYITGREGVLTLITEEGQEEQTLNLSVPVEAESEGGLLGFLLHPDDPDRAFIYYTYADGDLKNRVALLERDGNTWNEINVILEDIPGESIHNGGRLETGPDGYLYVTTGDAGNGGYSQDTENLAGKILRVNLDGTIPEDNPFGNEVYSYGHRNPQGMAWDDDGNMYATEHGATAHDEINLIEPGNNYGWPEIEGDEAADGMETPLYQTGDETWAPSGMAYGNGSLYIAALRGEKIIEYDLESGGTADFHDEESRFRDVHIEDSTLYAITNNTDGRGSPAEDDDRLVRIELEDN